MMDVSSYCISKWQLAQFCFFHNSNPFSKSYPSLFERMKHWVFLCAQMENISFDNMSLLVSSLSGPVQCLFYCKVVYFKKIQFSCNCLAEGCKALPNKTKQNNTKKQTFSGGCVTLKSSYVAALMFPLHMWTCAHSIDINALPCHQRCRLLKWASITGGIVPLLISPENAASIVSKHNFKFWFIWPQERSPFCLGSFYLFF